MGLVVSAVSMKSGIVIFAIIAIVTCAVIVLSLTRAIIFAVTAMINRG